MDESLWSTRNVAEFAYCARLFYLMEVEGIHVPSADTEAGMHVHRRVDRPSAASTEDDADRPRSVRSLTLTSQRLGITATLDLVELSGATATPVEYRKGRPKRVSLSPPPEDPEDADPQQPLAIAEPWPTDRVQVGLQAILLEEAGYSVSRAVVYYAEERLKLSIPVDGTLREEALAVLEAAKSVAKGVRPPPLVNDPRCIGCSLQPICLPDEVQFERETQGHSRSSPRKIWPPRDDGIHVVAQTDGPRSVFGA